jgi:hypothetical protein
MPARRNPNGPSRVRTVRFTDDEWRQVVILAEGAGKKPAVFLRDKTLEKAQRS